MTDPRDQFRTRENDGQSTIPPGILSSDTAPDPKSIFDSSQAEVMSDDDRLQKPQTEDFGEPSDMVKDVVAERNGTKSNRGKRVALGIALLLIVGTTAGLCFWFLSGPGATKRASVPVNKAKSTSQSDEAVTQKAVDQLTASQGVKLDD